MIYDNQLLTSVMRRDPISRRMDRIASPEVRCCHCKSAKARPTSIYCSDSCKQRFFAELRGEK